MALRQRVELELDGHDDPIVVEYSAVDLRAWERDNDKSALVETMSVNMLTWLGWNAARRQGLLNGVASWAEFDAACVGVKTLRDEGEPARPTKRRRSGAS
jgi:hypothetical protein